MPGQVVLVLEVLAWVGLLRLNSPLLTMSILVESEMLSAMVAALEMWLSRVAYMLQDMAEKPRK